MFDIGKGPYVEGAHVFALSHDLVTIVTKGLNDYGASRVVAGSPDRATIVTEGLNMVGASSRSPSVVEVARS